MKSLLLSFCFALVGATALAQSEESPSTWEITAASAGSGHYNINFHVTLGRGWHIWTLHPGPDSSLIPPSVEIDASTAKVVGETSEQGIATDMQLPGVEGFARFYNNEAMFIRQVEAKSGGTVKGSYTYQLCNDKMCLPPKTVPFSVTLP